MLKIIAGTFLMAIGIILIKEGLNPYGLSVDLLPGIPLSIVGTWHRKRGGKTVTSPRVRIENVNFTEASPT